MGSMRKGCEHYLFELFAAVLTTSRRVFARREKHPRFRVHRLVVHWQALTGCAADREVAHVDPRMNSVLKFRMLCATSQPAGNLG